MIDSELRESMLPGVGPTLAVRQLAKKYANGVEAVRDLTFSVDRGEVFGLLGPNGAGKSTTMSMLSGTTTPTSGSMFLTGLSMTNSRAVRRRIGIAFQDSVLDTEFSGRENLRLHARLWGMSKPEAATRIDELLLFMGLSGRADDNVRTYSGGMRRRLELARAILAKPALVLLDEPTVGLDPAVRDDIWALIDRMRTEHSVAIVVSTHYLEEAELACDRVGILHCGRLVAVGTPSALIDDLGTDMIEVGIVGDPNTVIIPCAFDEHRARIRRGVLTIAFRQEAYEGTAALDDVLRSINASGHSVTRAVLRKTTLADVFSALTADQESQSNPRTHISETEGPVAA